MKPLVSVITITYNHAPFISQCIEGILAQKTTFPFELVIGEDCSTDGTHEIVMDYSKKYPEIIQVATSESNVGSRANSIRAHRASQGEYTASCEGDDYWIDPLKLQKQYEASIKYDAVLVTHANFALFYQDGKITSESKIRRARNESGFLDLADIITGKALFHTSSFFLHTTMLKNMPDWLRQTPVGDLPLKVIAACSGNIYYIDEIMSVYRKGTSGSYTDRKLKSVVRKDGWPTNHEKNFIQKYSNIEKDFMRMYLNIDKYTKYQYTDAIKQTIIGRLIFYFETFGNLDFLPSVGLQKKTFKLKADLVRLLPSALRIRILRKIVARQIMGYLQGPESTLLID